MPTVKGVLQKYKEGQQIFRRESVTCLVARIEQLEKFIASQQSAHPTYGESAPPMQWTTPEDFTPPVVRLVPPISG